MLKNIIIIILGFILLISMPFSAYAEGKHDNTECATCHAMHGGMMGYVIQRDAEQQELCETCHNPLGDASGMSNVSNHIVNGGTTTVDCGSCHDPHVKNLDDPGNEVWGDIKSTDTHAGALPDQPVANLSFIRSNTTEYAEKNGFPGFTLAENVVEPAVFQSRPANFYFTDPPYNGICQTCHTQTDHYRNGSEGAGFQTYIDHNEGTDCTTCHVHKDGFMPGGCTDCHSTTQEGRRQIVPPDGVGGGGGDFDKTSHHVNGIIEDDDCRACHYTVLHGTGTVRLTDPDDGTVYEYNAVTPETLEPFCIGCHDSDGALLGNGTTPFSDGQTVPDIEAGGLWASSTHSTGGVSNTGYTCFGDGLTTGCHGNGHGSDLRKILAPDNGTPGTDNVNEEEGFCYNCHGSVGGIVNEAVSNGWFGGSYQNFTEDIEAAFGMPSTHPVVDSAPGHTFDLGDGNGSQELECTSCHDVHKGTGKYWDSPSNLTSMILPSTGELWGDDWWEKIGQFYSSDPTQLYTAPFIGAPGVDLSGVPLPIDGSGNSLLTGTAQPDYNTVCLECHQYSFGSVVHIDMTLKHMVAAAEPADNVIGWPMELPFDDLDRGYLYLSCSDCHEPHGSDNMMLVKRTANNGIVTNLALGNSNKNWLGFCDQCHAANAQARHHNDDVWINKLEYDNTAQWGHCTECHPFDAPDGAYLNCVTVGCHGHNDFF